MKVPDHIAEKAANDPNAVVMDWTFDRVLKPVDADTVGAYVKTISTEFLKLLHQCKDGDDAIRARFLMNEQFRDFSNRYPTVFKRITTREFATSPPLMSLVLFEIYTLQQVQKNVITEDEAKRSIAEKSFEVMVAEMQRKGISPPPTAAPTTTPTVAPTTTPMVAPTTTPTAAPTTTPTVAPTTTPTAAPTTTPTVAPTRTPAAAAPCPTGVH